jgi:uncharacterized membrane protein YbhN (UPF0104 family)
MKAPGRVSEASEPGRVTPAPLARHRPARRLRRALPWALAAAILWYLFRRVPVTDTWYAAEQARFEIFVPCALLAAACWFLLESGAFAYLFSRFNAALSWAEARSLRGLTYLLTPIHWTVGTGAIILHLRRSKGVGAVECTSSMLFYAMIDSVVLGSLALAGILLFPLAPAIEQIGPILFGFVAVQLALLALFMVPGPGWGWLRRIRSVRLFRTHGIATWRDVALLSLIRCAYFACFVLFFWVGGRAFQIELPLGFAIASTPLVLAAGSLPITPSGLGTQQAAMLFLFASYGSQPSILAFALAFPVAVSLARMPLGLFYIRDVAALRTGVKLEAERAAPEAVGGGR